MTTKVTITNDGPYIVDASTVAESNGQILSTKTLAVGQSVELYLWAEQSIEIVEPQPARTQV